MSLYKLVVLVSGEGSNLESIIESKKNFNLPYEVIVCNI